MKMNKTLLATLFSASVLASAGAQAAVGVNPANR